MRALKVVEQVQEPELAEVLSWNGRLQMASIAPNGVKKLRELILDLAMCGKLVPQDSKDEPAVALLKRIRTAKEKKIQEIDNEELPYALPKGWTWVRNSQLFTLKKGKNPKNLYEAKRGLPYLDIAALDKGIIRRYTDDMVSQQSTEEDLLVVCDGSRSGLILDGKKGVVGSTIAVIQCSQEIKSYLKVMFLGAYERLNKEKKGAAIPHLDTAKLIKTVIGLPPIAEQQRIVVKVGELMALCDKLEAQKEDAAAAHEMLVKALLGTLTQSQTAEEFHQNWRRIASHSGTLFSSFANLFSTESSIDALKQTILQLAVMGKLVPQNPEDEPASVMLKAAKLEKKKQRQSISDAEKPYVLPRHWEWVYFDDVAEIQNGYAFKSEEYTESGIRLARNINIAHGNIDWTDAAFYPLNRKKEFLDFELQVGDILLSLDRPFINTGLKIAKVTQGDLPALLLQRVARIYQKSLKADPAFVFLWFLSPHFSQVVTPGRSNGIPHISTNQLKALLFPMPPLAEQQRIVAKVDELMTQCDRLKERLTKYNALHEYLATALVEKAVAQ